MQFIRFLKDDDVRTRSLEGTSTKYLYIAVNMATIMQLSKNERNVVDKHDILWQNNLSHDE